MTGQVFFQQLARDPRFSDIHPRLASFLKGYLSGERVTRFEDQFVINTHLPPYPSPAFDSMIEHFSSFGQSEGKRHLFSVTLAVTNRCHYNCWHCSNAGRCQEDVPLVRLQELVQQLQDLGVVMVTLSGGEPLLRMDLEQIVDSFGDRTCLCLNTTGAGLTQDRAEALRAAGLFALGVSLDSAQAMEHDRMRGKKGAFKTALRALDLADGAGLYAYMISMATQAFLRPENFSSFMQFITHTPAREVHVLEPCATGRLANSPEACLSPSEREQILAYQREIAADPSKPVLSSFASLESGTAFGCGAGLTHLYIDGSGEVSPCNLLPLSFGNVLNSSLSDILTSMGNIFEAPRTECVGRILNQHIPNTTMPAPPDISKALCEKHLPKSHEMPEFCRVQQSMQTRVGRTELENAYNQIHAYYDQFWLDQAGAPIKQLIDKLSLTGREKVFEAGCGTGYGTALLAKRLEHAGQITAVDLSEGMLSQAQERAQDQGFSATQFICADALEEIQVNGPFDLVFSTWVLGYIPLHPFFEAVSQALADQGLLAFVVHKLNSPRRELEIFQDIVADDPDVLQSQVAFDFPRDMEHMKTELARANLQPKHLWEGQITFSYDTPEQALEHLLKSGAGTAYYEAVVPDRREELTREFIKRLQERTSGQSYDVVHDFLGCVATCTRPASSLPAP
jgi:MoaA/NifB/PqqE/SkfB family radical SAM enzyme/protein-L-isoaspartate O-methyltransferase